MNKFEKLKSYYDSKFWTKEMLKNAVVKKWITEKEYKKIVGDNNAKSE